MRTASSRFVQISRLTGESKRAFAKLQRALHLASTRLV